MINDKITNKIVTFKKKTIQQNTNTQSFTQNCFIERDDLSLY